MKNLIEAQITSTFRRIERLSELMNSLESTNKYREKLSWDLANAEFDLMLLQRRRDLISQENANIPQITLIIKDYGKNI